VNLLAKILANWRHQREAIKFAKAYHEESRARIKHFAALGKGSEVLRENLALMGIDITKSPRPRMVSIGGTRF
jgi:hypothetical protein